VGKADSILRKFVFFLFEVAVEVNVSKFEQVEVCSEQVKFGTI